MAVGGISGRSPAVSNALQDLAKKWDTEKPKELDGGPVGQMLGIRTGFTSPSNVSYADIDADNKPDSLGVSDDFDRDGTTDIFSIAGGTRPGKPATYRLELGSSGEPETGKIDHAKLREMGIELDDEY